MQIKWKGCCHGCDAPLDIQLIAHDTRELLALATYIEYYDYPDFYKNKSVFKVCGSKARRVCTSCYHNLKISRSYNTIKNRELIGHKPAKLRDPSPTKDVIKKWFFDDLENWTHRGDSDMLMAMNLKIMINSLGLGIKMI